MTTQNRHLEMKHIGVVIFAMFIMAVCLMLYTGKVTLLDVLRASGVLGIAIPQGFDYGIFKKGGKPNANKEVKSLQATH